MYGCPCGKQFRSRGAAMQCCGSSYGDISVLQALGAAEVAVGLATGDPGEVTAGLLEIQGVDPVTANAVGAIEDAFGL